MATQLSLIAAAALLVAQAPLLAQAGGAASPVATTTVISRDSLQRLVNERVQSGRSTGLIVGIIPPAGASYFAAAGIERAGKSVDRQTIFEIGSITKVFTGILLADMVNRGEVRLDQRLAELLPSTVKIPSRNGREITLADLSTQTSGLPRLPSNMTPGDPTNPYADYTVAQMYDFLSHYELTRDPGAQYEYSNLGVGLLGHALALRSGKPYETLVRERILTPLGMRNTGIVLTADMRAHVSEGHDGAGRVVPLWDLPTFAGAGALRSSLDDMMKFVAAVIAPPKNPVGRAIAFSLTPRFRVSDALSLGLNWHRVAFEGDTIVWHNGGTGGFRTYIGVDPRTRVGVVLLGNSSQENDDLGRFILNPKLRPVTVVRRTEITLPADSLRAYVGRYTFASGFAFDVTQEGSTLFIQATNQPRFPIYAEGLDRFFLKAVDAQLEFARDASGAVTSVTLVQGGRNTGRKVGSPE